MSEHTAEGDVARLTDKEIELREWLRSQPGGSERWTVVKAGFRRSYDMGMRDSLNTRPDAEKGLRADVTPDAVVALRLAADNMPISRSGQPWEGAADWLRRRADAFEAALGTSTRPAETDDGVTWCGGSHPGACHVPDSTGICELSTVERVAVAALIETGRHNGESARAALARAVERLADYDTRVLPPGGGRA